MTKGYYLKIKFQNGLTENEFDNITDNFIEDIIEKNNLLFGGGGYLTEYSGHATPKNKRKLIAKTDLIKILENWIKVNKKYTISFEIEETIEN